MKSGPIKAQRKTSGLEAAVELRLGEKRAGKLQDLIGAAQLTNFAFELFDALLVGGVRAFTLTSIPLVLANPQLSRVCGVQPILDATDSTAAHCEG